MRTVFITGCALIVAAVITGCASTPPMPPNVNGVWRYHYSSGPRRHGVLKLEQKQGKITGTAINSDGTFKLSGYVSNNFIFLHGDCEKQKRAVDMIAKVNAASDWMRGYYTASNNDSGPFFCRLQSPGQSQ